MAYSIKKIADRMSTKYFTFPETSSQPSTTTSEDDFVIPRSSDIEFVTSIIRRFNFSNLGKSLQSCLDGLSLLIDAPKLVINFPEKHGVGRALRTCESMLRSNITKFLQTKLRNNLESVCRQLGGLIADLSKVESMEDNTSILSKIQTESSSLISQINKLLNFIEKRDDVLSPGRSRFLEEPTREFIRTRERFDTESPLSATETESQYESSLQKAMRDRLNFILHQAFHISVSPETYKFLSKEKVKELLEAFERSDDFYMMQGDAVTGLLSKVRDIFSTAFTVDELKDMSDPEIDTRLKDAWRRILRTQSDSGAPLDPNDFDKVKALAGIYRDIEFFNIKKLNKFQRRNALMKLANF